MKTEISRNELFGSNANDNNKKKIKYNKKKIYKYFNILRFTLKVKKMFYIC